MGKKPAKKVTKSVPKRSQDKKKKLPRGFKECGNCRRLLHIHKYVCDKCGFKHDMKKKKVDILKNLNKVTPKLLRSLIELNDFNDLTDIEPKYTSYSELYLPKPESSVPPDYKKRRSSRSQGGPGSSGQYIWSSLGSQYEYLKMNAKLVCLCSLPEIGILVCESVEKVSSMSESEKRTISAFNLDKFHRVGQIYTGKSTLYYFSDQKMQYRINVSDHIVIMSAISNRVGVLTGRGTVLVFDLDASLKNVEDRSLNVHNSLEIKANAQDQITTLEWLKTYSTDDQTYLTVGTLMGHLYVFKIEGKQSILHRFIPRAHFQTITCIAECPLGNSEGCLFATGSYDGTLSVWSMKEREAIYHVEVSNRKICSLLWDPGAKFIFVVRDQNQDSGVLACFFAILKNDESVALSDQVDFRLIKNTYNCKVVQDRSNIFSFVDTYQCLLRVVEVEELRKSSLKRKKVKREEEETLFKLEFEDNTMKLIESSQQDQQGKAESRMSEDTFSLPVIADAVQMKIQGKEYVFGITFDGFLFQIKVS